MTTQTMQEITPIQAWKLLHENSNAYLIDVRSEPEWQFVGIPDLSRVGKELILLSWRLYPDMKISASFLETITTRITDRKAHVLFLCRSGARSKEAAIAMQHAGYTHCYNVLYGFEGDRDVDGHRGTINGWKAETLPWGQS